MHVTESERREREGEERERREIRREREEGDWLHAGNANTKLW
jgi:hypothetical protein